MAEPLFAILDETGTTNRPMVASDSNFAFGGLIAERSQLQRLTDISRQISKVVGEEDYKYRHVQRSTEARTLFLRAMNGLTIPAGGLPTFHLLWRSGSAEFPRRLMQLSLQHSRR